MDWSSKKANKSPQGETKVSLNKAVCEHIDVDQVWDHIGRWGKYQMIQMVFISIACLGYSPAILANVFVGKAVDFRCSYDNSSQEAIPSNVSVKIDTCSVQLVDNESHVLSERKCHTYDYVKDVENSFVSEWNTVCDRQTVSQMPQMLVMTGMAVGAALLPHVGDRYGRKILSAGSQTFMCLTMIGMSFVPNLETFLFLSFLAGAFNQGFMVGINIHMLELFTTGQRAKIGIYSCMLWVTSMLFIVPFAYVLRDADWRTLQLAYGLISAPVFIHLWFTDGSLRWFLANSKFKQAERILQKACRLNHKSYDKLLSSLTSTNQQKQATETQDNLKPEVVELLSPVVATKPDPEPSLPADVSILEAFKSKCMRKIMVVSCFAWMVTAQIYYGLTLLSTSLAGNPFVNFSIGAALEFPSLLISPYTLQRFGRKRTIIAFIAGAGTSLLAAVLLETLAPKEAPYTTLQTALTLIGKFHISGSFNALWIYTPELYPTNIRNRGLGIASTCGRIGAIASPFFHVLAQHVKWAPGCLFSLCAFAAAFLLTFMPETRWRELPNSVEEVDSWFVEDKRQKPGPTAFIG